MKKKINIKKIHLYLAGLLVLVVSFYIGTNLNNKNGQANYVAKIDGQKISRQEFDSEVAIMEHFFRWKNQDLSQSDTLRQNVRDKLINNHIILQYAQEQKIKVTEEELLTAYSQLFNDKTEEEYLALISDMYGVDKQAHLEKLKLELIKEKIVKLVDKPITAWLIDRKKLINIKIDE